MKSTEPLLKQTEVRPPVPPPAVIDSAADSTVSSPAGETLRGVPGVFLELSYKPEKHFDFLMIKDVFIKTITSVRLQTELIYTSA